MRAGARVWLLPDFDAGRRHALLGLCHGIFPKMKDASGQDRIGVALEDALDEVIEIANTA